MGPRTPAGVKRAVVASTAAHGLVLAALLIAGPAQGPPPPAQPIFAALISEMPAPRPQPAPSAANEPSAGPQPAPATAPERPGPAPERRAPAPKRHAPAQAPPVAPAPVEPAVTVEAQPPPASAPTAPPAPAPPDAPPAVAAAPAEPPPEPAADADDGVDTALPGEPLAPKEEKMLSKRLASWTGRFTAEDPEPTLHWREAGRQYTAVLRREPATSPMGMEHVTVEVATERDGNRMLTELRLTRVAFSNFAQFVDRWDPEVAIHDDEIDGRFHSNSPIHVSSGPGVRPVFRGKVTLAASDIETDDDAFGGPGWVNRRTMFPAGLETMVRRIALAPRSPPDAASDDVQRFEHDTAITFYADGSYGWRAVGGSEPEQRGQLTDRPHYLIGADERVTLEVRGTVSGTVLVYTPGRIVIVHDLLYAHDPHRLDARDFLGLVAERSVEIGEPDVTGPGDLEVDASIYARGVFAVRSFRSRRAGTLLIYGSLAAGSLTATEPRYATSVRFDQRLATLRAPGFPLSDRYELESSSGEWHRAREPAQ